MTNFHLKKYLYLLQLENYDISRFGVWLQKHDIANLVEKKSRLKFTPKIFTLYFLAVLFNPIFRNEPRSLIFSLKIIAPMEVLVTHFLVLLAKIKLKFCPDLLIVGIAGSYGKTSTKNFLRQLLERKYSCLTTPESFNTKLGICKTILAKLKKSHQIFICELGAFKKGDIFDLCLFLKPKIGILTAIGSQHLERFGSLENIISAKLEILDFLRSNNGDYGVVNIDDELIRKNLGRFRNLKILKYSLAGDGDLTAKNVALSEHHTSFDLASPVLTIGCQTKILGKHNVSNILAASAVAQNLGMTLEEISESVGALKTPSHRFEPILTENNTLILDNSYNANSDSTAKTLEFVRSLTNRFKIIVTPGLVELGDYQFTANKKLGQRLTDIFDMVIVVGQTNKLALLSGLKGKKEVYALKNLDEVKKFLATSIPPNSLILFENDLPDQYF